MTIKQSIQFLLSRFITMFLELYFKPLWLLRVYFAAMQETCFHLKGFQKAAKASEVTEEQSLSTLLNSLLQSKSGVVIVTTGLIRMIGMFLHLKGGWSRRKSSEAENVKCYELERCSGLKDGNL